MLRPVDLMLDPDLSSRTVILGGGPAGLSAAYELARQGHTPLVLESDDVVGGLARTVSYKEFLFDIGGHRFFTKSSEVQQLWQEILGSQLMTRSRLSRIRYRNRFFHYPLKPFSTLLSLGIAANGPALSTRLYRGSRESPPAGIGICRCRRHHFIGRSEWVIASGRGSALWR
jgi:protoporphyrinogen oxidase